MQFPSAASSVSIFIYEANAAELDAYDKDCAEDPQLP